MFAKLEEIEHSFLDLERELGAPEVLADQERYRNNLESVGRDTSQGQQYTKRIMDAEAAIDQTAAKINDAQKAVQDAQAMYEGYLVNLNL